MTKRPFLFLIFFLVIPISYSETVHELFHLRIIIHSDQRLSNEQMLFWDNFWGSLFESVPGLKKQGTPEIHFVKKSEYKGRVNGMEKSSVAGFAIPSENRVVIFTPLRVPEFPLNDLNSLIKHELMHIAVYLVGGNKVPVWIQEGAAQYYANQYPENPAYWTLLFFKRFPELAELETKKFYSSPKFNYPFAYHMASFLINKYGEKKFWEYVRVHRNPSLKKITQRILRMPLSDLYAEMKESASDGIHPPFFFSPGFLLTLCAMIVPGAYLIRRRRLKKWMEAQEEDDQ